MTDKLCLTIEQAAAELQISRSLAYQMARDGTGFPVVRISKRRIVVPVKALEEWLQAQVKVEAIS